MNAEGKLVLVSLRKTLLNEIIQYIPTDERFSFHLKIKNKLLFSITFPKQYLGLVEKTLTEHSNYVYSVISLSDGRIASGSVDKTIKIWDTQLGKSTHTLNGHNGSVCFLTELKDGRIASASYDKTIKLWELIKHTCIVTLTGHNHIVYTVIQLSDSNLLSGSHDNSIKLWDINTLQFIQTIDNAHINYVYRCIELKDGRVASCSSVEAVINIWKRNNNESKFSKDIELKEHKSSVYSLIQLRDSCIASGDKGNLILVWNVDSRSVLFKLEGHTSVVWCLARLDDGRLVSGSDDCSAIIWDLTEKKKSQVLVGDQGHTRAVRSITQLKDRRIITASNDKTLKIWY